MDFVKRAGARAARKEARATMLGSLGASKYVHSRAHAEARLHPYLRASPGAEYGAPFDGKGLPSINAMMTEGTKDGIVPLAMFNIGYKHDSTFPVTLDPQQFNQTVVYGDSICIKMPSNYEAYSSAIMSHGLDLAYTQHGKIFATRPLKLTITKHFVGTSTSAAFPIRSRFGRITLSTMDRSGEGTSTTTKRIPAGTVFELGPLTQALVSVPEVGAVDKVTGRVLKPQYLITDKVIIKVKG